jgi:DNA-binding MarR family transcriptional regulator
MPFSSQEGGLSREVLIALRRIMRAIDLHSRQLMQQYGISGPQLVILQELSYLGEVPIGTLATAVSLSQATVTGIIDRLEKRGFIVRRRDDDDKRRVLVTVTAEGKRLLLAAPPPLQESFVREFSQLMDWEQSLILSSLQRVVSMMEASELEATPMLASGTIATAEEQREKANGSRSDSVDAVKTGSGRKTAG